MTKFTAPTIELALLEASKELKCSIVDLEYEIIEKPSKGFLGLGKRDAKIVVSQKRKNRHSFANERESARESRERESVRESKFAPKSANQSPNRGANQDTFEQNKRESHYDFRGESRESKRESYEPYRESAREIGGESIRESAHKPYESPKYDSNDIDESIIHKIHKEINELFALLPIKLSKIEVSKFEKNTILIHFKGADAALLIGERGYRYKAISYLLFNWLNAEYGVNIRLEIESFLVSQEAMISHYLAPIIEELKDSDEPFATKTFDGILAYIALKELRAKLHGKNIVLKTNENDESYVLIQPLRK